MKKTITTILITTMLVLSLNNLALANGPADPVTLFQVACNTANKEGLFGFTLNPSNASDPNNIIAFRYALRLTPVAPTTVQEIFNSLTIEPNAIYNILLPIKEKKNDSTHVTVNITGGFSNQTGIKSANDLIRFTNIKDHVFSLSVQSAELYVQGDTANQNKYVAPTPPESFPFNPSSCQTITVPGVPTALSSVAGNASVALTWTAPGSTGGAPITDYVIQFASTQAMTGAQTFNDGISTTPSATVTGLTNGTTYFFRILAANSVGNSQPSAVSAAATPAGNNTTTSAPNVNPLINPVVMINTGSREVMNGAAEPQVLKEDVNPGSTVTLRADIENVITATAEWSQEEGPAIVQPLTTSTPGVTGTMQSTLTFQVPTSNERAKIRIKAQVTNTQTNRKTTKRLDFFIKGITATGTTTTVPPHGAADILQPPPPPPPAAQTTGTIPPAVGPSNGVSPSPTITPPANVHSAPLSNTGPSTTTLYLILSIIGVAAYRKIVNLQTE